MSNIYNNKKGIKTFYIVFACMFALALLLFAVNYVRGKAETAEQVKQFMEKHTQRADILPDTDVSAGDYITFGAYYVNDTSTEKRPIEWLVLDKDEDKMFIISRYPVSQQPYHLKEMDVTWQDCTLRDWLNKDFLSNAFTENEQAMIVDGVHDKSVGTSDKVFLLSVGEAHYYFDSDSARACDGGWWLRSPSENKYIAAGVNSSGWVNRIGFKVVDEEANVRPALVIKF